MGSGASSSSKLQESSGKSDGDNEARSPHSRKRTMTVDISPTGSAADVVTETLEQKPHFALQQRLHRRMRRWAQAGEIPAYHKLKFRESFKEQIRDAECNRFGGEMGAYADCLVNVTGVKYINASPLDNLDSDDALWIATMCPKQGTISAFWQMAWERNSRVIVNLTGPQDSLGSKPENKRERYWPPFSCDVCQDSWPIRVETINVATLRQEKFFARVTVRLTNAALEETREIVMFWYVNWIDMGEVEKVGDSYFNENSRNVALLARLVFAEMASFDVKTCWTIVHCSAGVGRTGTFVTVMHVLRQIHSISHVKTLDLVVWRCIERIRLRRLWMVKTAYEYATVFGVVLDWLRTLNGCKGEADVDMTATMSTIGSPYSPYPISPDNIKSPADKSSGSAASNVISPSENIMSTTSTNGSSASPSPSGAPICSYDCSIAHLALTSLYCWEDQCLDWGCDLDWAKMFAGSPTAAAAVAKKMGDKALLEP